MKHLYSKKWLLPFTVSSLLCVAALISCSSSGSSLLTPPIPQAKSELVPPELTAACPIQNSFIDSFTVKGTGAAFNGASFGSVGTYKYILAEAVGKVKVDDPCAATIVDLKNLAYTADSSGYASYSFDVVILTPSDSSQANGTMIYDVTNRGDSKVVPFLLDAGIDDLYNNTVPSIPTALGTNPVSGKGSGNAFLLKRGYTVVWSGWQGDVPQSLSAAALNGATPAITATKLWYSPGMTLPVAKDASKANASITGTVQDEYIADKAPAANGDVVNLNYKWVSGTNATLTVQLKALDNPIVVDPSLWSLTQATASDNGSVNIQRAKLIQNPAYAAALDNGSDNGTIYHINYTAVDPKPYGLGFLGNRDLIAFLRYETQDAKGNTNPLAGLTKIALSVGNSQAGRYVRDFLWQGFNTSAKLKPVFDGMMPLIGGSRKTYTNFRWAKPGDFSKQHETHFTPGDQFPFAYQTITDPISGKTDGLLNRCTQTNDCPKVIQYDSTVEFYNARAALNVTNGQGQDIPVPNNVRMIYASGTTHTPTNLASNALALPDFTVAGTPSVPRTNPDVLVASTGMLRALLINLEGWIKGTATPLASNYPSVSAGTLATPTNLPNSLGSPDLSALGLTFNGNFNTLTLNDYSVIPSVQSKQQYTILLPVTDSQGNDKSGVKMPDVAVPLATFKGYNYRRPGYAVGDLTSLYGSQLPFSPTQGAGNDPRKGFVDLYGTKSNYLTQWNNSVDALIASGYLLSDDRALYINRGIYQSLQPNFSTYLK
jgi:Alpha/beta hydrolase domain